MSTPCHCCEIGLTEQNVSVVDDTCADCLQECGCWACHETRAYVAQDGLEEADLEAWRELRR